jgi:hypothetical protein
MAEYNENVTRGKKRNSEAQQRYYKKQKTKGLRQFHAWVNEREWKAIVILLEKIRNK